MYGDFAQVYDLLMDDVDYPAWADFYQRMMAASGVKAATLAECACGTGSMSIPLAKAGFKVTGLDISGEMLRTAQAKARRAGLFIPFIQQDMRGLALHKPVDAVLAPCDGVNYLLTQGDVGQFFRAAHAQLRPGGGLFFDVSSQHKLLKVLADQFYGEERQAVAYLWQNRLVGDGLTLEMDLTFFLREADGRYRRFAECHRQRAHTPADLCQALVEAGYEDIRVYGDKSLAPPGDQDLRLHFAARRGQ